MKNQKNIPILAAVLFFGALSGFAETEAGAEVSASRATPPPAIDGKLDDSAWRNADWIALDLLRPTPPESEAEWRAFEKNLGGTGYERRQFAQKTRAAVLHSPQGLFFAMEMEDMDVVGRMKDGETLWLEDTAEIFIASRVKSGAPYLELQFSPANSVLMLKDGKPVNLALQSATAVDGTINDSLNPDTKWSVEVFLPWDVLEAEGIAQRDGVVPCAVRFSSWDLSLYSQLRLNRLSTPGDVNPHEPRNYRKVLLRQTERKSPAD